MEQFTIIADHNKNYKTVSLKCVEDNTLSWKAKAIHLYLISRPPNWVTRASDLKSRSTDGHTSYTSGINELIRHNYVYRLVRRNDKKQICQWCFYVNEEPVSEDVVEEFIKGTTWNIYERSKKPTIEVPINGFSVPIINRNINTYSLPLLENKFSNKDNVDRKRSWSDNSEKDLPTTQPTLNRRKDPPPEKTRRQILTEKINKSIPIIEKEMKDKEKERKQVKLEKDRNEPLLQIPKDVQIIFDEWEKAGFKVSNSNNKTLNHTIRLCKSLLKGSLPTITGFSPFPGIERVVQAIGRYRLAAFEKEYFPGDPKKKKDLQKKMLADFILDYPGNSYLSKYDNSYEPQLLPQYKNHTEDLWPNGTKQIMNFYREHARSTLKEDFTIQDMDKFRRASNMCKEFWDKHQYRIRGITGYRAIAECLCEAVWVSCGEIPSKLYTGSFCTPYAKDRMIAKLSEEGLISESDMGRTNVYKKHNNDDISIEL